MIVVAQPLPLTMSGFTTCCLNTNEEAPRNLLLTQGFRLLVLKKRRGIVYADSERVPAGAYLSNAVRRLRVNDGRCPADDSGSAIVHPGRRGRNQPHKLGDLYRFSISGSCVCVFGHPSSPAGNWSCCSNYSRRGSDLGRGFDRDPCSRPADVPPDAVVARDVHHFAALLEPTHCNQTPERAPKPLLLFSLILRGDSSTGARSRVLPTVVGTRRRGFELPAAPKCRALPAALICASNQAFGSGDCQAGGRVAHPFARFWRRVGRFVSQSAFICVNQRQKRSFSFEFHYSNSTSVDSGCFAAPPSSWLAQGRVAHPFSLSPQRGSPPFAVFEGWDTSIRIHLQQTANKSRSSGLRFWPMAKDPRGHGRCA
jgi:hypothetical protein